MTGMPHTDSHSSDDDAPQSMSLLGGVAGGGDAGLSDDDLLGIDSSGGKKISQNTLLIVGVAVVAIGVILLMRLTQGSLAAEGSAEVEARIETALAKLSSPAALQDDDPLRNGNLEALFQDTGAIIAMFASDTSDHQVPVKYLKKNPFALAIEQPEAVVVDTSSRDHARRVEALRQELGRMSLQTIMVSDQRRIAIIDGELVQPGQAVGSFTVVSMDPLEVTLTAAGERFTLALKQQVDDGR